MSSADAQIAKYQAWADKLESNIVEMAKQRAWSWAYLAGGIVLGFVAWRFNHFLGGSVFTLGLILWITALYITAMRTWYYRNELTRTRYELEQLAGPEDAASGGASRGGSNVP